MLASHVSREKSEANEIFFATNATWALNPMWSQLYRSLAQAAPLGQTLKPLATNDPSTVVARTISLDGRRMLIACWANQWTDNAPIKDRHFQLWDLASRERLAVWPYPTNAPNGWRQGPLVFSPDGRRVASGCFAYHGIEIWDTATGKRLHELHQPDSPQPPPPRRPSMFARLFRGISHFGSGTDRKSVV